MRTTGPGWSELRAEGERVDRVVGFIALVTVTVANMPAPVVDPSPITTASSVANRRQ